MENNLANIEKQLCSSANNGLNGINNNNNNGNNGVMRSQSFQSIAINQENVLTTNSESESKALSVMQIDSPNASSSQFFSNSDSIHVLIDLLLFKKI
jgi:hypothetical protein